MYHIIGSIYSVEYKSVHNTVCVFLLYLLMWAFCLHDCATQNVVHRLQLVDVCCLLLIMQVTGLCCAECRLRSWQIWTHHGQWLVVVWQSISRGCSSTWLHASSSTLLLYFLLTFCRSSSCKSCHFFSFLSARMVQDCLCFSPVSC